MRYRKIKWRDWEPMKNKSLKVLNEIWENNSQYIDMEAREGRITGSTEERWINSLQPLHDEIERRKANNNNKTPEAPAVTIKETTMAKPKGVSQDIINKATEAHELMNRKRNPLSVRKATDQAGLSIASYYKVFPSNASAPTAGTPVEAAVSKGVRGRPKSRHVTSGNIVNQSKGENLTEMRNYISKLERKIVRLTLDKDEE
jgi:hypothetical protein